MNATRICHTNPCPPAPNLSDLHHHHYQIHHHQILQSNFNHNSNIFWTIEQPKPPTPSRIKERGTERVNPRKEEIEGVIKEATLMAASGSEWWGRKPQPPPPIWVSQHTQRGDAVLPIVFSDPCCPPSTEACMIKTQKRDKQIWSPLVPAPSELGKIRYPTIGSFAHFNVIRISSSLFQWKIEFNSARKPFKGFSNGGITADFRLETLNLGGGGSNQRWSGSGQLGSQGKRGDRSKFLKNGLDPKLNFGITVWKIVRGFCFFISGFWLACGFFIWVLNFVFMFFNFVKINKLIF